MTSDFREKLRCAAKDLGIEPAASSAGPSESGDTEAGDPKAERKDLRVGDLVRYIPTT